MGHSPALGTDLVSPHLAVAHKLTYREDVLRIQKSWQLEGFAVTPQLYAPFRHSPQVSDPETTCSQALCARLHAHLQSRQQLPPSLGARGCVWGDASRVLPLPPVISTPKQVPFP